MVTLEQYLIDCITSRPNAEHNVVSHLDHRLTVLKVVDSECDEIRGHRNGFLEVIPHPIGLTRPRIITLFLFVFQIQKLFK